MPSPKPASKPTTVPAYLKSLPENRRELVGALRDTVRTVLPKGYEEGMQYGMIGYYVPHAAYPPGYHCDPAQPLPFIGIGNQKGHVGLYMFCLYNDPEVLASFTEGWKATGKRLDMGKSCVRVKKLEDAALDVIARTVKAATVKKFIAAYERSLEEAGITHKGKATTRPTKKVTKKATKKKRSARA